MKQESHKLLGYYLINRVQGEYEPRHRAAFLLGCVEPDRNPFTYFKGSCRAQWMRGHNFLNAQRLVKRLCRGLENRENWRMLDYYRLGKLIHYTADAFTFAHNAMFQEDIRQHLVYEGRLQEHFKQCLQQGRDLFRCGEMAAYDMILEQHRRYENAERTVETDAEYILGVTELLCRLLLPCPQTAAVRTLPLAA